MFVMEPANEQNKEYSHVAHKMKWNPMKFEDYKGTSYVYTYVYFLLSYSYLNVAMCMNQMTLVIL